MKPKKSNKKLFLNKKTVAHLSGSKMGSAYGGKGGAYTGNSVIYCCLTVPPTDCFCPTT